MQLFKILNIIILILFTTIELKAQPVADIYTNYTTSDTVNYGFVLRNKSKAVVFTIKNISNKPLKIRNISPSFSIEFSRLPGHENDHDEFRSNFSGIKIINPNDSINITVTYYAEKDTSNYKIGTKFAKFILGVYDANLNDNTPPEKKDILASKEFLLKSYKVKDSLSFAVQTVDLNPVYVTPPSPFLHILKFQNMSNDTIKVIKQYQTYTTPFVSGEFEISNKVNLMIPPNTSPLGLDIYYSPKDTIKDTVILGLVYEYSGILDSIFTEIRGYPVFQRISVFGSDSAVSIIQDNINYIDTVFIGKTRVNNSLRAKLYLINKGNINFTPIGQQILDGYSNEYPSNVFKIISKLPEGVEIPPETIDSSLQIVFEPNSIGTFIARYKIRSDIINQNIAHFPKNKEYETIILKGIGLSSLLSTNQDTVDFGIISSNTNCNSSRTFTLKLKNSGNENLIIKQINISPPFELYENPFMLKELIPSQEDSIRIIFSDTTIKKFYGHLDFITNSIPPYDTVKVALIAERVPLSQINISLPKNSRIKPGNKISIPLLVDKEQITKAKSIECEITFERTLLKYLDFDKIGTAAQNTDNNDIQISESQNGGLLELSIHTPGFSEYFLHSDTLINLIFDSYIGNKISTPLSIINPTFGDGICQEILIPKVSSGLFTIDSICGLTEKLVTSTSIPFFISEFQPNPSNDIAYLNYQIKADISLNITLFNQIGDIAKTIHSGFIKQGLYEIQINTSELSTGVYFLQFKTGYLTTRRKLIITK